MITHAPIGSTRHGIESHANQLSQQIDIGRAPENTGPAEIKNLFSSRTWVAPEALPQLKKAAELPGMVYVAAMPDLHPGTGSPGGAAFMSKGLIHPKLIGGDIGCGMHLCSTSIDPRTSIKRLGDKLSSIDGVWEGDLSAVMRKHGLQETGYEAAIGTIGGGNHFAELQVVHSVVDAQTVAELGISSSKALLLIHSGSRGFGQEVLNRYNAESRGVPLDPNSPEGLRYLAGHDQAMRYAKVNREIIAHRIMERLGATSTPLIDLSHNYLESKTTAHGERWIHRKGAAPSDQGLVVIPGSRSSFTYIVRPIGNGEVNAHSLAHGAGRKISRSQCDEKFGRLSPDDLRRPKDKKAGIDNLVICENKDLLRQEHGKAYKDIDQVIEDLVQLGLVEVVAVLKPILTYKTRAECEDGDG
jgi:release factor H-coupled RctB family protein